MATTMTTAPEDDAHGVSRQRSKTDDRSAAEIEADEPVRADSGKISHQSWTDEVQVPNVTPQQALSESISYVLMAVGVYLSLLFLWKFSFFLPFDSGFAMVVLWAASMVLGTLFRFISMPPLLGMLCAGILVKNVGDLPRNLPEAWADVIRSLGLVNILMRGGLELDLGAIKRLGMGVVRLTVLPGVTEAFTVSFLAMLLFGMPFFLALSFGFILAAVSPAVVVGGMFDLQARGYGVKKGIPSLVIAAASFDDVVAISGFSMFIGLAVSSGGSIVVSALSGPISIIAGGVAGVLGGLILAATNLWNTTWKRSFVMVLLAIIMKMAFKMLHFDGAGALAALMMAAAASQFWAKGLGFFSAGPDHHAAHNAEVDLCKLWRLVSEPLLFAVIGSALDFRAIDMATIPKAMLLLAGGVAVRTLFAFLSTYGCGMSIRERYFVALAWMPKATVQAALGSVPLALIMDTMEDDPEFEKYKQYGMEILTCAIFSIIFTAPAGLIIIQKLGPRCLTCDFPPEETGASMTKTSSGIRDTYCQEPIAPKSPESSSVAPQSLSLKARLAQAKVAQAEAEKRVLELEAQLGDCTSAEKEKGLDSTSSGGNVGFEDFAI